MDYGVFKRAALAGSLAVSGCSFTAVSPAITSDASSDGAVVRDAPGPGTDGASACFGSAQGEDTFCLASIPTMPVTLSTPIDTDTSALCRTPISGLAGCVIAGTSITVTTVVRATGSRPLILATHGTITIDAIAAIDVASHGTSAGANADAPGCPTLGAPSGSGGGAGGSFGGKGGDGGAGDGPTPGGTAAGSFAAPTLRGGCSGGAGASGGAGGPGGGAVLLVASAVVLDGYVNASGAGGAGASGAGGDSGGGGGGAGGMIAIDASAISGSGVVFANGGGGGAGTSAGLGSPGGEASPATPTTRAAGGMTNAAGGAGGAGSSHGGTTGANGPSNSGGGGGGGGVGVLRFYRASFAGTISPS